MTFEHRLKAFKMKRQLFYVPDVNHICFATNEEHCKAKFMKHKVIKCGLIRTIIYVIIGK